jgi:hypothetical protein
MGEGLIRLASSLARIRAETTKGKNLKHMNIISVIIKAVTGPGLPLGRRVRI